MKRLLFILLGSLAISCSPLPNEKELLISIKKFNTAYEKGNVGVLGSMITENYVHTNSFWKSFGKQQWIKYMENRSLEIKQNKLVVHKYEMEELNIEFHENTAIVTCKILSEGVKNQLPFSKKFRITTLWVFKNGQWLRAGFHDTIIE